MCLIVVALITGCKKTTTTATTQPTQTTQAPYVPNGWSYDELVIAANTGEFANANYNTQLFILSKMEGYLLNNFISIPIYSNAGFVIFSDRMVTPVDHSLPVMGFDIIHGSMTTPDAGTTDQYTYRTYETASPKTLNHLQSDSSVESDQQAYFEGSLFEFILNDTKDGYRLVPSMAAQEPTPGTFEPGTEASKEWTITIRQDLKWSNGEAITADDFLYTYKMVLDPKLQNIRANYFYGQDFPIVGAEEYYKQGQFKSCTKGGEDITNDVEDAEDCTTQGGTVENWPSNVSWDTVGLEKVSDYSWKFTLKSSKTAWDVKYLMGDMLYAPVYETLFEAGMNADRTETNYGTSLDTIMSSGPYKLTYWEDGKELRFEKNEYYFNKDAYNFTGVKTLIVQDANAALLLFKNGELDQTAIPSSEYENYKNDPRMKRVPGATVFRLQMNYGDQDLLDSMNGGEDGSHGWIAKPILQDINFRAALYYSVDRNTLSKYVLKTTDPAQAFFSSAYAYDPENGTIYRDSEMGESVIDGLSPETYGYAPSTAADLYVQALTDLKAKNQLPADNKIQLEIALFSGATQDALGAWLESSLEALFNNAVKNTEFSNISFDLVIKHYPGMDVYYQAQMPAKFDLALGGISGSTLDPLSYLDVFCSDNRSGLFLNWGLDTSKHDLIITADEINAINATIANAEDKIPLSLAKGTLPE